MEGGLRTAIAAAAMFALGAPAAPAAFGAPPPLVATSGEQIARGKLGSSCWSDTPGQTVCADAAYPLRGARRLRVRAGARVALFTTEPAAEVTAALYRARPGPGGSFRRVLALSPTGSGSKWAVRLPRNMRGGTVLDVFVRYAGGGDADFWVWLKDA